MLEGRLQQERRQQPQAQPRLRIQRQGRFTLPWTCSLISSLPLRTRADMCMAENTISIKHARVYDALLLILLPLILFLLLLLLLHRKQQAQPSPAQLSSSRPLHPPSLPRQWPDHQPNRYAPPRTQTTTTHFRHTSQPYRPRRKS